MVESYLTEAAPRWLPKDERDLESGAEGGLLEETHYLDLKRELAAGKGANKELARDLAQFAIDGGALLIGVAEQESGPPTLAPVTIDGLPERIESVARSVCDPPLSVACSVIGSEGDASRGYVLVRVPASGLAPHMVDGVYYARGDKTRSRLSDAEVLRLHAARQGAASRIQQLLDAYIARDPVPGGDRRQARLYFVAAPVMPRHEMLLDVVTGEDRHLVIQGFIADAASPGDTEAAAPNLVDASVVQRRPDGIAMTAGLEEGRRAMRDAQGGLDEDIVEVEFTDEGTVRLLHTRLSYFNPSAAAQELFSGAPVALVRQGVQLAGAVGRHANYGGGWMVGVAVAGIAGLQVHTEGRISWREIRVSSDLDEYRADAVVSAHELTSMPGAVTGRLAGRYLRGLGMENRASLSAMITD